MLCSCSVVFICMTIKIAINSTTVHGHSYLSNYFTLPQAMDPRLTENKLISCTSNRLIFYSNKFVQTNIAI